METTARVYLRFTEEDVKHFLLPREHVIYSYVVENNNKQITDFVSFYNLPSSVLQNPKYTHIKVPIIYYLLFRLPIPTIMFPILWLWNSWSLKLWFLLKRRNSMCLMLWILWIINNSSLNFLFRQEMDICITICIIIKLGEC